MHVILHHNTCYCVNIPVSEDAMDEKFLFLWVWVYFNLQGKSYSKDTLSKNYFSNLFSSSIAVMVCDLTIQTVHVQQPAACHNSKDIKDSRKNKIARDAFFRISLAHTSVNPSAHIIAKNNVCHAEISPANT